MYIVKKNGRKLTKLGSFLSYERARQAVRAILRRNITSRVDRLAAPDVIWDGISRNPSSIKAFGYDIVKT